MNFMHARPMVAVLLLAAVVAQAPTAGRLTVAGMPADAPLTVAASFDAQSLRVQVELKPGWHLYGREVGCGKPVAVHIVDGAFAAAGELVMPMDDTGLITGKGELRLPLRRAGAGDSLRATMCFMVCDPLQCLPPIELELRTPCSVLLVAVDEGERTQRIATFLRDRGFAPTVTTYATATTAQCDAHEVVLADSPTFGQVRGKKINARAFPKTESPVIAVGLLGTELLEAHKVAMACGYI